MSDSLTYVDKCMIAAMATMNASYLTREGNVISASNAAIETMQIKTLAEYYKGDPEKLKTYDPSKIDNKNLMRTYVIPLVLDNGEKLDLVVNKKGQDMACVRLDADSKESQFELTPRMRTEIENALNKKGIAGLEIGKEMQVSQIKEMVEPRTLDEFTEAVGKDELLPKSPRDTIAKVKSRNPKARIQMKDDEVFEIEDEEDKAPGEIQEEISLEEERLGKIAEKAGMSLEDMKRFCKENKLTSKSVMGAIGVVNVDELEEWLDGTQLNGNGEGSVVIIRTQENGLQNRARIANTEGRTLFDNSKYDDKIVPLVPEHATSEKINDLDEYEEEAGREEDIIYTDNDGQAKTLYIQGNEVNSEAFEERFNTLKDEYKQKLQEIEDSTMEPEEKSKAREDLAGEFYASVCTLEKETGVVATEVTKQAFVDAEEASKEHQKTVIGEAVSDVLDVAEGLTLGIADAVAGTTVAAVIAGTGAELIKGGKKEKKTVPDEEKNDGYGNTIGHYGRNLEEPHVKEKQ